MVADPTAHHPARIRPGQRFFPRQGHRRLPATVRRVDGESIMVRVDDGSEKPLALDRLLAIREDGRGRFYQLLGWRPKSAGYRTELEVLDISVERERCILRLPEWDPSVDLEQPLSILPDYLRNAGASGSCLANLASTSVAGLAIHDCGRTKVRGASREAVGSHPTVVAKGQRYRPTRKCATTLELLDAGQPRARAWNGRRVVLVSTSRLLDTKADGTGRFYEYLGGGVWATRRVRGSKTHAKRARASKSPGQVSGS